MNKRFVLFLLLVEIVNSSLAYADTIRLKNGQTAEGIIEQENNDSLDLNLGYGTVTFKRSEIANIQKSNSLEAQTIWNQWIERKNEEAKRRPEEETRRKLRELEADKERQRLARGPKEIHVTANNQEVLVDVLLNGKIPVTLILDSGASFVVLSENIAERLGIDTNKLKKASSTVADGRAVEVTLDTLDSIKVLDNQDTNESPEKRWGVELKNVQVCFMKENVETATGHVAGGKTKDGLLGMSFLQNFKFQIDYQNNTMSLEKIEPQS